MTAEDALNELHSKFRDELNKYCVEGWDEGYLHFSEPSRDQGFLFWQVRSGRRFNTPSVKPGELSQFYNRVESLFRELFQLYEAEGTRPRVALLTVQPGGGHRWYTDFSDDRALNISPFLVGAPNSFFTTHDEVDRVDPPTKRGPADLAEQPVERIGAKDEFVDAIVEYVAALLAEVQPEWELGQVEWSEDDGQNSSSSLRSYVGGRFKEVILSTNLQNDFSRLVCGALSDVFDMLSEEGSQRPTGATLTIDKNGKYDIEFALPG